MKEYFVITTENCGRCAKTKAMVDERGLTDRILFLDYHKDGEARALAKKFGVRTAGTIHRMETGERVNLSDLI